MIEPIFFSAQQDWHKWLEEHHDKESEIWIGFYKTGSGIKGITNKEAVDEALCFGWIDGLVKGIDNHTWKKRFTPRKPRSIWSNINIKRVEELSQLGLMRPEGLKAFSLRDGKRSGIYSFENERKEFSGAFLDTFLDHKGAWQYFLSTAPSYQKVATHWVLSAKQEATRQKRLQKLIEDSEKGKRLDHLTSPGKRS
jgi:uncharacterized protein YdeI (YjbR/CyaY-like superfamily)